MMETADGDFQSFGGLFCLWQKSFTAIINMTYSCRVGFDMIHTERERNEDRQADRDTVRAAAGRENYGTGACGTV